MSSPLMVRKWLKSRPLWIALSMAGVTLLTWVPFLRDPSVLCRFWDGPLYMVVAKTLYRVPEVHPFHPYGWPASYFACHLPAYPLLIRALTPFTGGGYPPAMLLTTLLSSVACALLFYRWLKESGVVSSPLWTALFFAVLPPRWMIYHATGATEPLFLCFVFGAFLCLRRDHTLGVALCLAAASLTRITGLVAVAGFAAYYISRKRWRSAALLSLSLSGLLALFCYYYLVYGDFFAYFTWNMGKAGLLRPLPFQLFRSYAASADFHGAETFIALYLSYGLGTLLLWKHRELFFYCAAFFLFNLFVVHLDMSRYFLPAAPFALLVGFDSVLRRPAARLILPLALFLGLVYAWGYIPNNAVVPGVYSDLVRFLSAP